jgi:hypothetical protein
MQKRSCQVMGYPLQILIYFPKQYMTVVIVIGLYRSTKQVLWKKFRDLFRILFRTRHNNQPTCTEQRHLPNQNHWCSCHTREKTWLATHSPYKRWRVRQRQGNGTVLHIQFCPLLSHVHVSRLCYTTIALFHVAAAIVRHLFKFVFLNGTTIA